MKIGATISPALLSLLSDKRIDVDYIEVNGERDLASVSPDYTDSLVTWLRKVTAR